MAKIDALKCGAVSPINDGNRLEHVVKLLGTLVCLVSKFLRFKKTDMNVLSVNRDAGTPFLPELVPANADVAGRIIPLHLPILTVLPVRTFTKISNTVITSISIDMVDVVGGKAAMHKEPSQTMGEVTLPIESNLMVAVNGCFVRVLANVTLEVMPLPCKRASERIVIKLLNKLRLRNVSSHNQPLSVVSSVGGAWQLAQKPAFGSYPSHAGVF